MCSCTTLFCMVDTINEAIALRHTPWFRGLGIHTKSRQTGSLIPLKIRVKST